AAAFIARHGRPQRSARCFRARARRVALKSLKQALVLVVRLADDDADLDQALSTVQSMLVSRGCRLQNSALYKGKQQLEFFCISQRNSICASWSWICERCCRMPTMLGLQWISYDVPSQPVS